MFRSYPIGRLFGIPIRIHGTLLVFLPFLAYLATKGEGVEMFLSVLTNFVFCFGCVLLHELGHSLAARGFGIQVKQIVLYPMGGIAGLASMPRAPGKELVITIAGPAVNFILAGVSALALLLQPGGWLGAQAEFLLVANLVLGIFNLIPGFPMDGGRILRALLAYFLSYELATWIAAQIGRLVAVAFVAFGFFHGPATLVLVGMFVFLAAGAELRMLALSANQELLAAISASDLSREEFRHPHATNFPPQSLRDQPPTW